MRRYGYVINSILISSSQKNDYNLFLLMQLKWKIFFIHMIFY